MIKRILTIAAFTLVSICSMAQQGVKISSSPGNPDPSAGLEVSFTDKGFLPPRLTTTQRNAIVSPAIGLLIYNTTTACAEMYFLNGWKNLGCNCNSFPNSQFTNSTATTNANVTFTPQNIPGATYSWTFQNGNPATSTQQNPVVVWTNSGTYTVTLTITDNQGCASTTTNNVTVVNCPPIGANTLTFNYTGSQQTWTVPNGICTIRLKAYGAEGGNCSGKLGGRGGYAVGELSVIAGQVFYVNVGGKATDVSSGQTSAGGWNGGGYGGVGDGTGSAGGGGGTDVRTGGTALNNRVIVAGGGGGQGCQSATYIVGHGDGGGLTGSTGTGGGGSCGGCGPTDLGGSGGTQNAGGAGGTNCYGNYSQVSPGQLGIGGGVQTNTHGGGGGGGYYGGGAGSGCYESGGGGGSSYIVGLANASTQSGVRTGHGQVIIEW